MKSVRRSAAAAVTVLAMAGSIAVLGPVGTASAASCHGTSCNGKDPQATGCSADAVGVGDVLEPTGNPYLTAELRYSAACDAAWVRLYTYAGGGTGGDWIRGEIYGEHWNNNTRTYWATCEHDTSWDSTGTAWSVMCGGTPHYHIDAQTM